MSTSQDAAEHRLLVANRTLLAPAVEAAVLTRPAGTRWWLVVPATPPAAIELRFLASEHVPVAAGESPGWALARWRLRTALDRLEALGVRAAGETGDPDPLRAAGGALERIPAVEVLVGHLRPGRSVWRERRVAHHLAQRHALPVSVVDARLGTPAAVR